MYYLGHMGYFGGFWMIFFWIAVFFFIIWMINQNKKNVSPTEILKQRYAKGEITKKQYEQTLKDINK